MKAARKRRTVLVLWIVAFVGLGVVGRLGRPGPFSTDFKTPGSESKAAQRLLKSKFPEQAGDAITVIYQADGGVADPAVRPRLDALISDCRDQPPRGAGRAVLFAGTTVVISVLGMLLMGLPFLEGVAVGSAAVVLVTMLGSVTLLPAMLGFVGPNIDRWKVPFVGRAKSDHRAGFWFRWSRLIQRRPWTFAVAGLLALLLLAAPIFSLRLGFPGDEAHPTPAPAAGPTTCTPRASARASPLP